MKEATLCDRKGDSDEKISDPAKISNNARYFVRKARELEFIDPQLIDWYEDMFQSETANSGNPDNHNTSFYADMPAVERELNDAALSGKTVVVQAEGCCG